MSILVDLSLVLVLVAFNGVFAMAEIAILHVSRTTMIVINYVIDQDYSFVDHLSVRYRHHHSPT